MQAVQLLRQCFPTNLETLEELASIADRIEKVAEAVDLPNAIRSPGRPETNSIFEEPAEPIEAFALPSRWLRRSDENP